MAPTSDPRQNRLLGALPEAELARWLPHLEAVDMPLGTVLCEPGARLAHAYFPVTSAVSLLCVMEDGASAETAVVGREGMLGVALYLGGESTPSRAVVQGAGHGFRLRSRLLLDAFHQAGPAQALLLRYAQALLTHMAQIAVCNRHHSLEQQLCRWLLQRMDCQSSTEITMTQELIASMLGVRREGVTQAAGRLQELGLIRYHRGHIALIDRERLQRHACECYCVLRKEYDRLLPPRPQGPRAGRQAAAARSLNAA
ncbi:Crp/Fnr family transcriptional regulator [Xylophilus sp. ASV27]|uniref:Crp/Fnr family transcriptional regulator n=1 Tax=Xylophilus sp. ASV27 TaxID=2795129 RepID=UPI0018EE1A96|nr:Crp/Fnr family transcriptional regulator [Xylophilus sp. ASV27]